MVNLVFIKIHLKAMAVIMWQYSLIRRVLMLFWERVVEHMRGWCKVVGRKEVVGSKKLQWPSLLRVMRVISDASQSSKVNEVRATSKVWGGDQATRRDTVAGIIDS